MSKVERGCFNCGKTRGVNCDQKREQHEYCRPWIPKTVSSNHTALMGVTKDEPIGI